MNCQIFQRMKDVLFSHRSIRKFDEKEIPEAILKQILLAGSRASTTGNMQVYSIIISKDQAIKEKLWSAHFKQNMVKQAPVILTFCADFQRFNQWCVQRNAVPGYANFLSFITAAIDALLAAQNIAIAAEDQGLGICYLGTTTYMAESIIDILKLPAFVVPVTSLVIGYPAENPALTDRLPLRAVVHQEQYQLFSDQEIDDLYAEKEQSDFTRELLRINQKESLAQIFTDLRYTQKDNELFSKAYLRAIEKQGFNISNFLED